MANFDERLKKLNAINLIQEGLEREVKKTLTESVVKKQLEEFEAKLREQIKPLINEITFKKIERLEDYMLMRDELRVLISWNDEEPVTKNN